jgi:beta-N-acetylhexosaminidase
VDDKFQIGECFILGFRGSEVPAWLERFSENFGLGGVILFDYDYQEKIYKNNVNSKHELKSLCEKIHSLPSSPMVYIDQEGGKVRRLKETLGFAGLPSQKCMMQISDYDLREVLRNCFTEMRTLGIDANLAPVVDLDYNPNNPDIGAIERSFSRDPGEVCSKLQIYNEIAQETGIFLCQKHFPGLGAAGTNSHLELTYLDDMPPREQLELFTENLHGNMVLVSHAVSQRWGGLPASVSPEMISTLRGLNEDALVISDDMQMQGMQKMFGSGEACRLSLKAGVDQVILGNNLLDEQSEAGHIASYLLKAAQDDQALARFIKKATQRVRLRKKLLN